MPRSAAQTRLKNLALLASLLLVAVHAVELQHLYCEADQAGCAVCASSLQDDAVANSPAAAATWPAAAAGSTHVAAPALFSGIRCPARARAPPPLSI